MTLRTGEVLHVRAHAYEELEDGSRFVVLMEGEPLSEIEVLRIPRAAVSAIRGG